MRDIEQEITRSVLLNSGDVVQSHYRILYQLGFGEYSRTYLAEDLDRLNERCVVKEFAAQLQGTSALKKAQELFERDAGVLYRLQHLQIPQFRQLLHYNEQDKERLFLVRDYVEGVTYRALLNQRLTANLRFTEQEIKQLLIQVLPILEYIHSMGVIHRDISPDNLILRTQDKLPVLIDFGCIKEIEGRTQSELGETIAGASRTATVLGRAGYAPPEQVERGIVYAHSDLYALAATAVVLLTGREPQRFIDPNGYRWNWRQGQSGVTLSPKLEWILSTMLSPHPSDRFGSAAEVSKTLQDISAITISQFTQNTDDQSFNYKTFNHKTFKVNAAFAKDLLSKSLFFVPFTAVLFLGGYLCLQVPDLEVAPVVSDTNNSE